MVQKISLSWLWLAAFLCSLFFVNAWQLELFAAAIVLIFIWAVISLGKDRQWQIPSSWPLKIMAAFWLLVFLSILGSDILSVSLMAFCFFSALPLTFFIMTLRSSEKDFIFIAKVLGVVYAGLSLWALVQFFVLAEYFDGRARHPLANPNSLAALLSLGFFCAVGGMLADKENLHRYIALAFSLLLFAGIMVAGSRGALFAGIPALALFLFCMRDSAKKNLVPLAILFLSCGALFFLTSFGIYENENLFDRVIAQGQTQDINRFTSNRMNLWLASWEIIKNHGLWGTGIGTYFLYFPEFRLSEDPFGAYYAHNDPLQYWVELGILGPVLFYAFVIAIIGRTVQAVKKTTSPQEKLLILTPFFALGASIIHTHVTFNLYNLSILFVMGFLLAVWFQATERVLTTDKKQITFPESYATGTRIGFIALPFALIGAMFLAYIAGEHYNNKARDHLLVGELELFASNVLRAQNIGLNGNYRPYLLAVNVPLSTLEEGSDKLNPEQKRDLTQLALSYLQHVRHINPRSSSALFYLGKLKQIGAAEALPDTLESAESYYAQALKIDPLHIGARLALAKIYEADGKTEEALALLEQGTRYKYVSSNAIDLYATLARYHLMNGNAAARDKSLRRIHNFQKRIEKQETRKSLSQTLGQHL